MSPSFSHIFLLVLIKPPVLFTQFLVRVASLDTWKWMRLTGKKGNGYRNSHHTQRSKEEGYWLALCICRRPNGLSARERKTKGGQKQTWYKTSRVKSAVKTCNEPITPRVTTFFASDDVMMQNITRRTKTRRRRTRIWKRRRTKEQQQQQEQQEAFLDQIRLND